MAASSDKNGCWIRQKNGNLVFVSKDTPDHYKSPLPDATQGARDADRASSSRTIDPLGMQGTWDCGQRKNNHYGWMESERVKVWVDSIDYDHPVLRLDFLWSVSGEDDWRGGEGATTFLLKGPGPTWSEERTETDDNGIRYKYTYNAQFSGNQLMVQRRLFYIEKGNRPDLPNEDFEWGLSLTCTKQ